MPHLDQGRPRRGAERRTAPPDQREKAAVKQKLELLLPLRGSAGEIEHSDREPAGRRPGIRRTVASNRAAQTGRRFQRRPGPRFTGRAAVLAVVLALLALTLAYPARQYFAQQAQIAQMERDQASQRERIHALQGQKDQWKDPDYIRSQARKRRQYVQPGEMAYVIKDENAGSGESSAVDAQRGHSSNRGSWYKKLWSTVQAADRPAST